jgi:hypothetical protein
MEFYLIGLGLGVLLASQTIVYCRIAIRIKSRLLRHFWAYSHTVYPIAVILFSDWIFNHVFLDRNTPDDKRLFVVLWVVPYAFSLIWCYWRYRDRLKV